MKKIIMTVLAAATMAVTGCKTIPSAETMTATSLAVGKAAGYVANQTKIDDKSRNVVVEVVTKVAQNTPAVGQTFADAWTPTCKEIVDKYIAKGEIDQGQAALITAAFTTACQGLDYLVDVRYPKAREYAELVSAAVNGFTSGFLSVFKPVNYRFATMAGGDYDKAAYEYLMKKAGK